MPRPKLLAALGPDKYLDVTADMHNGIGSKRFRKLLKDGKSDNDIAKLMGVSQPAASNYRHLIEDKDAGSTHSPPA